MTGVDALSVDALSVDELSVAELSVAELSVAARSILRDPAAPPDARLYQRLLADAPVLRMNGGWLVSGHAQVTRLACEPSLSIDPRAGDPPLPLTQSQRLECLFGWMLNFRDGEPHARLRRLVATAFSARRTSRLAAVIESVVAELLDDLCAREHFDAVADLGVPLPVMISCALLDLPRDEWSAVAGWAGEMSAQLFRFGQDQERLAGAEATLAALTGYVEDLADRRRGRPGDLIADLLREAETGDGLSRDEFVAFVVLLFMNGLETVTAAVASCVAALLWRPGLAAALRARPERAGAVFDELMRLDAPVRMGARRARTAVDVPGRDGARIEGNDPVFLFWAAANRDPRVFADPDDFRPGRTGRHLAFGQGPHHCLGAGLAGLQGAAVLRQLVARADLDSPVGPWAAPRRRGAVAGYARLPVTARSCRRPAQDPHGGRMEAAR